MTTSWWAQLWEAMVAPAWWAQFFQTLVAAGIAFYVALIVLRRQLQHDRQLANAERQSERAAQLGRKMLVATERITLMSDGELVDALAMRRQSPFSGDPDRQVPGNQLARSIQDDLYYFAGGDVDSLFWKLWLGQSYTWLACSEECERLSGFLQGLDQPRRNSTIAEGVRLLTSPYRSEIRELAYELIKWEGRGEWPRGNESYLDQSGILVHDKASADRLKAGVAEAFRRFVEQK